MKTESINCGSQGCNHRTKSCAQECRQRKIQYFQEEIDRLFLFRDYLTRKGSQISVARDNDMNTGQMERTCKKVMFDFINIYDSLQLEKIYDHNECLNHNTKNYKSFLLGLIDKRVMELL